MVKLYTKEEFITQVETLVRSDRLRYTEAIREVCEERGFDIEDLIENGFITAALKQKIEFEAIGRGTFRNQDRSVGAKLYAEES
jgi:delta-aminolevulinic acid dehydratase/porphobilinogen synthase